MKKILYMILLVLPITACNRQDAKQVQPVAVSEKELDAYEENDTPSFSPLPAGLEAWLAYYQRSDARFALKHFHNSGVSLHFDQLPDAMAREDTAVFQRFYRFSPDRNRYIDLFSYDHIPDKGMLVAGETDQEVILGDRSKGLRRQLMFNTTGRQAEWADWLNNDSFLIGLTTVTEDGQRLGAQILMFRVRDSSYTNFDLVYSFAMDSISFVPMNFQETYIANLQKQ